VTNNINVHFNYTNYCTHYNIIILKKIILFQLIFFGGFYEPTTLEWIGIDNNIIIINSLTSTDGINPRLVSTSNILHIE